MEMAELQDTFKKYRDDRVFQWISSRYLSLDERKTKINNTHLKRIVEQMLIPLMKEQSRLFNVLYSRIMYGGSFYKKTKFGNPEEFDLDIIFKLPGNFKNIQIDTSHDNYGFVKIQINEVTHQHPKWSEYERILGSWLTNNNYLNQNIFRAWFESVFSRAVSKLKGMLDVYDDEYEIKDRKSGPAFTLTIHVNQSEIDVDLVPCFEFDRDLGNGYRSSECYWNRKSWYAIPKPLYKFTGEGHVLWRLCFYEHEKEFLDGNLKDIIRMIKKFRNSMGWRNLASYHVETVFFNELQHHKDNGTEYIFLHGPKTGLFMHGLKKLLKVFEATRLPYYWHPRHNLLQHIHPSEMVNWENRLRSVISLIDRSITNDKNIIAHFVLEPVERFNIPPGVQLESYHFEELPEPVAEPASNHFCSIL